MEVAKPWALRATGPINGGRLGHPRESGVAGMMFGKILYGVLFVAVLPGFLILWGKAAPPNILLPVYGSPLLGYSIAACGLGLMFAAKWAPGGAGGGRRWQ